MGQSQNRPCTAALSLFGCLVCLTAAAADIPATCPTAPKADAKTLRRLATTAQPDRGFLWEISKDGRRSYLYATVHVAKLEWDFPGPRVKSALAASQVVAVELDLTDPGLANRLDEQERGQANRSGRSLAPSALADLVERLHVQFRRACVDEGDFAGATLGSKATWLWLLSARDEGLYPQQAIDSALVGFARATGKDVVELETAAEQAEALGGDPESLERGIARLESGEARAQLVKLTSAWAAGDFATMETYFSWCQCSDDEAAIRRSLRDRNAMLAQRIARLHEVRGDVFAAVGVLHMIGPTSILEALRGLGYSVVPATTLSAKP